MRIFQTGMLVVAILSLAACTSDPAAPVNQTYPIKQMDQFFNSLSGPTPARDYHNLPGYAPAYPPY